MLDKIIDSCNYVVNNSKNVKINYEKLDNFIKDIDCNNLKNWLLFNPNNLLEFNISKLINFLLIFESIDYCFWGDPKWEIIADDGSKKDGSDALLYCMLKLFRIKGLNELEYLSMDEFKEILNGNVEIPLLKERYETLIKNVKIVKEKMNGDFYNYIKDIYKDEELFNIIIENFDSFNDVRIYNDKKIYFYKLAQLLTSDILHIREYFEKCTVDYSKLLGCADYKIPQTLRAIGILEYNKELSNIIDNGKELEKGSEFEVEIRASQLFVINYIKNKINVNAIDINDYLFLYSKKVKTIAKPYHLCKNTNY